MRVAHGPIVTVVIAAIDARVTVAESVARFTEDLRGRGEVILVDASRDGTADEAASCKPSLKILRRPVGRLAPELWRDGLESARTPLVAFSTAQMVPKPGWCTAMLDAVTATDAAGVGGPIAPAPRLSNIDRALYLLRYANYLPPLPNSARFDPPGDNALYQRDRLLAVRDSWISGFWELEVHDQLRRRGEALSIAHQAVVEFQGGSRLGPSARHRHAHAQRFGASRAAGRSLPHRLGRTLIAPAVPAVMLARIVRNLKRRGEPIRPWTRALPQLAVLLSAWSVGEATGVWLSRPSGADHAA
jgi:Glycosyl transferase family 2